MVTKNEAIEAIRREFERQFGVTVSIKLYVHWTLDGLKLSRDDAAQIAYEVSKEIGGTIPRHAVWGEGKGRHAWVETEKENVSFAIFYHTEESNARESRA